MINGLQVFLYKLSIASPALLISGMVWWVKMDNKNLAVVLFLLGAALTAYGLWFLDCCREELAPIRVEVGEIAPNDGWCVAYAAAYLLPLADFIWDGKLLVFGVGAVVLLLFVMQINHLPFHPVFLLTGYHCYRVMLSGGLADCLLISRQKRMRSHEQVSAVLRINEHLFLDVTGGKEVGGISQSIRDKPKYKG